MSEAADQIPSKKVHIDTSMRFSFRNKEEGEAFLTDLVKLKLNFVSTLEENMVPSLISKNISLVLTFGNKFL
jgi:hypothetical protein